MVYAHVFAWVLEHGPIPSGLEICHSCDVPDCCEVSHMRLGTRKENMRDRSERFVNSSGGEGHGNAKLTHLQAMEIYDLAVHGSMSQRKIGAMYGVGQTVVSRIKLGKRRAYSVHEHEAGR